MAERNVTITLTANVDAYVESMERAQAATIGLIEVLERCGITKQDMPSAIEGVLTVINGQAA